MRILVLGVDGYLGWPEHAPFDKIIVTCSPQDVPKPLVEQLKEGGRLVVPLGERYQQTLFLFTKVEGSDFPLVTNLFGTARRAERAFGRRPLRLVRLAVELAQSLLPPTPARIRLSSQWFTS